jgi:hypothetical protein
MYIANGLSAGISSITDANMALPSASADPS